VTAPGLLLLRESGFTRLSLGVQSLNDGELRLLGREHTAQEAREAIAAARAAGFDNLSLDLINCLPGQTPEAWQQTLDEAVFWMPEHLSCYGLSLEEGTPLQRRVALGKLAPPDEGLAPEIFERTHRTLTAAGYEHYEIANFARPGRRCRHNENYWRNGEYVGIGAGATGYLNGFRIKSDPDPARWAERVLAGLPPALVQREALDDRGRALEVLMLALRTRDGLDLAAFCRDFGLDQRRYELRLQALVEAGLAEPERDRLVLTPVQGFLVHSEIVQMFM
jgi:oxygen-independent coproporphyrinogen-3 oxidase